MLREPKLRCGNYWWTVFRTFIYAISKHEAHIISLILHRILPNVAKLVDRTLPHKEAAKREKIKQELLRAFESVDLAHIEVKKVEVLAFAWHFLNSAHDCLYNRPMRGRWSHSRQLIGIASFLYRIKILTHAKDVSHPHQP